MTALASLRSISLSRNKREVPSPNTQLCASLTARDTLPPPSLSGDQAEGFTVPERRATAGGPRRRRRRPLRAVLSQRGPLLRTRERQQEQCWPQAPCGPTGHPRAAEASRSDTVTLTAPSCCTEAAAETPSAAEQTPTTPASPLLSFLHLCWNLIP